MKRVVVGMSGGVDSSVTAFLLKQQGYDVVGLFMNNWEEQDDSGHCTAASDFDDVRNVCSKIDIPYFSVNFAKEYKERVFSYFLEEYQNNRTPNPDVMCNREIKFGPFLQYAKGLGAEKIATGHFAGSYTENERVYLAQAKDKNKDQTYFLHQLSQEQLSEVIFPLCNLTKAEVRQIASENGLSTAEKKDSTGICFIGERNFRNFLSQYLPGIPGDIITADGKKVGQHIGLMYYTLGQRRGLNIGGVAGGSGRWFVLSKDLANNVLYVSQGEDDCLFTTSLTASGLNWIPCLPKQKIFRCFARTRHRQPLQQVTVQLQDNDSVIARFDQKQRAVTAGQYVVFYDEKNCIGGGVIDCAGDF